MHLSKDFSAYLKKMKKDAKLADEDQLQFDSLIESGNLDRVEAYPMHKGLDGKAVGIQKYNLYCKVDTNTRGH